MVVDHVGVIFFSGVQEWRIIGRLSLPLYIWSLIVGTERSRNLWKYALRILCLAVISQPLYVIVLQHEWNELNVLFLLFLGVLGIIGMKKKRYYSQIWMPALTYVCVSFLTIDYNWKGLTFLYLLYLARENRKGLAAAFMAFSLYWGSFTAAVYSVFGIELKFLLWKGIGTVLSPFFRLQGIIWLILPLILIPTHSGIRIPKWLSYLFYPLHLLVLMGVMLLTSKLTLPL